MSTADTQERAASAQAAAAGAQTAEAGAGAAEALMQRCRAVLQSVWGYDDFRGVQADIIRSVLDGRDTLGLMPTGGGKSLCFQVPALVMGGLAIVVTPLISLMDDQVQQLRKRGIKACAVHIGMTQSEVGTALDNCILGGYHFLYLSPERLTSPLFLAKLARMQHICLVCVDEAHCVSSWGYDFRPSYLQIRRLREAIPYPVPMLALTATATERVARDVMAQLAFDGGNMIRMSFERKNLAYVVRQTDDKPATIIHILQQVREGSAIVYTRSRRATVELKQALAAACISADAYHAGLSAAERRLRQNRWLAGQTRVMVATNAFGMGIDKPDVRVVVHYNVPDSIEAYFQEAGRAGRDGKHAYAVLLYNKADGTLMRRRVGETYPPPEFVRQTYEHLCYFYQFGIGEGCGITRQFVLEQFCATFHQSFILTDSALRLLHNAGYITYETEQNHRSRIHIIVTKEQLNRLNELSGTLEAVMRCLLRTYAGIFADFVDIDEPVIAAALGTTEADVYGQLKVLRERRILDYIPRSTTPTITFRTGRTDSERIHLVREVYADRRRDYAARIEAILHYVTTEDECRSRMLLRYFDERHTHDCEQCDVCLHRHRETAARASAVRAVADDLRRLIADGHPHPVRDLPGALAAQSSAPEPTPQALDGAIRLLLDEGEAVMDDDRIRTPKT